MNIPSVLLVNDISCVGKVALTLTLPIFSALSIESDVLPTVLLSTHSGGFGHNTRNVLTQDMHHITAHWQQFHYQANTILTGYFGDTNQLITFLNTIPPHHFLAVDPVMADNGKLYRGFSNDYPLAMKRLCQRANVIFPNITEAFLLLDERDEQHATPDNAVMNEETIKQLLYRLQTICPNVVLTGVQTTAQTIGAAYLYDGHFGIIENEYIPHHFFGTGDLFSAMVTGLVLHKFSIETAIDKTLAFIVQSLKTTLSANRPVQKGILFEPHLHHLTQLITQKGDLL